MPQNKQSKQLAYYYRNRQKVLAKLHKRRSGKNTLVKTKRGKNVFTSRRQHRVEYIKNNYDGQAVQASQQERQYLHRLYRTIPLAAPLPAAQQALAGLKPLQLRYSRQYLGSTQEGVTYRLTGRKLVVTGIRLYGSLATPSSALLALAEAKADAVAAQVAAERGLTLDIAQASTKLVEMAIVKHQAASSLTRRFAGKLVLYTHPITGLEVWADRTPNPASVESNSPELLEKWRAFTKALEEGQFDAASVAAAVKALTALQAGQLQQNEGYKQDIAQVNEALARLADLVAKLLEHWGVK